MCWPCVWLHKHPISYHLLILVQHTVSINTTEDDPHSDSLHHGIVKPKNLQKL